ncbi:MAG: cupredoxin domain-containing protein [Bdellovibrionales bacterium]|nr:cupredoxin domain-containing protein [Bdellovibrionales bacterium]
MKSLTLIILLFGISTAAIASQSYNVEVTKKGFEPSRIEVNTGEKLILNITRKVKTTCAKKITVPSENIEKDLPFNKTVSIVFTPNKKGEISFGCAMKQMLGGVIFVK